MVLITASKQQSTFSNVKKPSTTISRFEEICKETINKIWQTDPTLTTKPKPTTMTITEKFRIRTPAALTQPISKGIITQKLVKRVTKKKQNWYFKKGWIPIITAIYTRAIWETIWLPRTAMIMEEQDILKNKRLQNEKLERIRLSREAREKLQRMIAQNRINTNNRTRPQLPPEGPERTQAQKELRRIRQKREEARANEPMSLPLSLNQLKYWRFERKRRKEKTEKKTSIRK